MKGKDLLDKINFIDDDLIQEAGIIKKKRKTYTKWYVIACSLCVILIGTVLVSGIILNDKLDNNNTTVVDKEPAKNSLVYIPKIELPEKSNIQADMVGLIVYKGKIYTQGESFQVEKASEINNLVGNRLGYAKGNIDEWSKQEEYDEEFAGTVSGDVYTVNGYSEDFRICIKGSYEDDEGKVVDYIHFYENLNGIGLNTGKDLFGDRLKLEGNWDNVKYLTHENWNNGWTDYNYLDLSNITEIDINKFIQELYRGEFVDLTYKDIYDKPNHHLFIYMKDNTRVELRLFEGGYVGYQPLGWYFVKMPRETFDKLYEASK